MSDYRPTIVQTGVDVPTYLNRELSNIARAWREPEPYLYLQVSYKAPTKIVDGMIVLADGTSWNPGTGAGIYARIGGAWVKL